MQRIDLGAAQNSASGAQTLPRGSGSAIILATDPTNNAGAIVELELSYDDAVTWGWIASLIDLNSTAPNTKVVNLTGPNKHGQAYLDGAENVQYRVKRTDAAGGVCVVHLGITTSAVD